MSSSAHSVRQSEWRQQRALSFPQRDPGRAGHQQHKVWNNVNNVTRQKTTAKSSTRILHHILPYMYWLLLICHWWINELACYVFNLSFSCNYLIANCCNPLIVDLSNFWLSELVSSGAVIELTDVSISHSGEVNNYDPPLQNCCRHWRHPLPP